MKQKKLLSFIFGAAMTLSLLPVFTPAASATTTTEKNITLGASALSGYDSTNGYKYVYYGTYGDNPIKWRILSMNGNDGTYNDGGGNTVASKNAMFLLSEDSLKKMEYDADMVKNDGQTNPSDWRYGDAWHWCNNKDDSTSFISSSFTDSERKYLLKTSKANSSLLPDYTDELKDDTFFFLSFTEAGQINVLNGAYDWWFRTPNSAYSVNCVNEGGTTYAVSVDSDDHAARPAFNLDSSKILFTSAADNKMVNAAGGNSVIISPNADYTLSSDGKYEYKLTLLDTSRKFSVEEKTATGDRDETLYFNYKNAEKGGREFISAMIVDNSNNVLYYNQVVCVESTVDGRIAIVIPSDIPYGSYKLHFFNECLNGKKAPDYSSEFQTVELSVEKPKATFTTEPSATVNTLCYSGLPHDLVNEGHTNDGTVMYSLSENGTYSDSVPTGKDAGDYTVWYYIKGDNAHLDSVKKSIDVKIFPLPVDIKWDENDAFTYDGNEKEYTATITNIEPGDTVNITYSGNKETNVCTLSPYIAQITAIDNPNYTLMGPDVETEHDWWINPKIVTAAISNFDINNPIYTGMEIKPNFTVFDGTTVIPENEYMIEYLNNINAGTATIRLTDKEYGNYTVSGSTTFTIKPLPVDIKWKNTDGLVYDGTAKTVTAEVLNRYGTDEVNLSFGGDSLTQTDRGTYTATVTAVDNNNYTIEDGQNLTKE